MPCPSQPPTQAYSGELVFRPSPQIRAPLKTPAREAMPQRTCLRRHLNFVRGSSCLTLHGSFFHRMAPLQLKLFLQLFVCGKGMQSLFSASLRLYAVSIVQTQNINILEPTRVKTYKPSWLFQFHAGALDFSILGLQTTNQRLHRGLKMSKHGLLYFIVFEVPKFIPQFPQTVWQ